jgi:hypothetical protein
MPCAKRDGSISVFGFESQRLFLSLGQTGIERIGDPLA